MKRRNLIGLLVSALGGCVLASCGGSDAPDTASDTAAADRQRHGRGHGNSGGASSPPPASAPGGASAPPATGMVLDVSFGVKGDGTTDDTAALQKAIDGSLGQILLITGQSRINATGLQLRNNSHVRFNPGATLKLLPHSTDTYNMLQLEAVSNVIIESPYLDGSKELNKTKTGEWGMGISINGASNVIITNPTTINCWGDGIYINNSDSNSSVYSTNVTINGHHASGCRRQGVSIISGSSIIFNNPLWENIAGTAPSCGLDIEPNDNTAVFENIRINNPTTKNCAGGGINVYFGAFPGPVAKTVSIAIVGHHDSNDLGNSFCVQGLSLKNGQVVNGIISSADPVWVNNYAVEDWSSNGPKVFVTNATITM